MKYYLTLPTGEDIEVIEGQDVSEMLGIQKYIAPVPACLAGEVKGMFPGFMPKTDQERIQNLKPELVEWQRLGFTFEKSEKLDGTSMSTFLLDGEFSICSRNLELKPNPDNSMFKAAAKQKIEEKLRAAGRNLALQGELIGNGIQGNKYKLKDQGFYVFDIYDIDGKRYFTPQERKDFVAYWNIAHVPVFNSAESLAGLTVADLLVQADVRSVMSDINGPWQEGHVYKCNENPEVSFKVISNLFLLKNGD